jgi:hypothetical protein
MKALLLTGIVVALAALVACKRDDVHDRVQKNLSDRVVTNSTPELGTDPAVRVDTQRGGQETTSGTSPGSSSTPRSSDTQGGGSATGAGGAGPGYRGDATNAPK